LPYGSLVEAGTYDLAVRVLALLLSGLLGLSERSYGGPALLSPVPSDTAR